MFRVWPAASGCRRGPSGSPPGCACVVTAGLSRLRTELLSIVAVRIQRPFTGLLSLSGEPVSDLLSGSLIELIERKIQNSSKNPATCSGRCGIGVLVGLTNSGACTSSRRQCGGPCYKRPVDVARPQKRSGCPPVRRPASRASRYRRTSRTGRRREPIRCSTSTGSHYPTNLPLMPRMTSGHPHSGAPSGGDVVTRYARVHPGEINFSAPSQGGRFSHGRSIRSRPTSSSSRVFPAFFFRFSSVDTVPTCRLDLLGRRRVTVNFLCVVGALSGRHRRTAAVSRSFSGYFPDASARFSAAGRQPRPRAGSDCPCQDRPPARTSGAPRRAASAVRSSACCWDSRSAATRAR